MIWLILHLIINVWYSVLGIAHKVESTLISSRLLKSYNAININKVRYLAVVIESEEARQTSKVLELLHWLASIGIKSICLYDREGKVVKKLSPACSSALWCIYKTLLKIWFPQSLLIVGVLKKSQEAIIEGLNKSQESIIDGSDHGTLPEVLSSSCIVLDLWVMVLFTFWYTFTFTFISFLLSPDIFKWSVILVGN